MQIKRGDIFYIKAFRTTGSEQRPGRPAVIVSNDDNNSCSATVEVVYLTTQPKTNLPTHVEIYSSARKSIAICEQITTVALERLGDYSGHVTEDEMADIDLAMLVSLDLYLLDDENSDNGEKADDSELAERLKESEMKCKMLQQMYDALLSRIVKTV